MSRCFPFPPPGYEKKARSDESDLLKKEKQREKKPKKEKKDKEKRESKEKKEKDRSDENHREKKEKKEKHRDKERKDREKEIDKSSNSDDKRFPGNSEGPDGGKSSNEKKFPGKYGTHSGEKVIQKKKEKDKDRNSMSGEKKFAGKFSGYSGEKLSQNSYRAGDVKGSKSMQDLGRRIGDEDGENGNQLVEKFSSRDAKRDEGMHTLVSRAIGSLDEGKEKNDKKVVDRKLDVQYIKDKARFSGYTMGQNPAGMAQTKVEGMPRPTEKDVESRTSGKEKTEEKKEGEDKRGDKLKDKDRDKKAKGKDKDRDKEKKKEEKVKMKSEHKNSEKDTIKGSNKDGLIVTHNKMTLHPPMGSDKGMIEQNVRKRKDFETNGFVHINDVQPNKLPRPTSSSSSHPLKEYNKWPEVTSSSHSLQGNGRIVESCQTSTLFAADRHGAANSIKADSKEHKVNGVIVSPALSVSAAKPTTAQTDQIAEVSLKPPHPDSKYLSQVLSVPKMEDWFDFDDQEWLFHNANSQSKKPKVGSSGEDETPQVWAEAVPIESADVCALPYVIPY